MNNNIPANVLKQVLSMQKNEITEYYVYQNIAKRVKNEANKKILIDIAQQEKAHHDLWESKTGIKVKPNKFKIRFFSFLNYLLGFTFTLRVMESGEDKASTNYDKIVDYFPEAELISNEESKHEQELISLLNEERLDYVGSIVLGLNDALVELTGTLAGLTLAFVDAPQLIPISGLITGIAASLSMASSEYLSGRSEGRKDALRASVYTGITYMITVILLILPYFFFQNTVIALGFTVSIVVFIIFIFNFYISVAKKVSLKERFFEMFFISLGVTTISFAIGYLVNTIFNIGV